MAHKTFIYPTSLKKDQDKERSRVYEWVGERDRESELELKLYLVLNLFQELVIVKCMRKTLILYFSSDVNTVSCRVFVK